MSNDEPILNAVGDIALGPHLLSYRSGVDLYVNKFGIESLFRDIKDVLGTGSINFGNLECVLSKRSNLKDIRKYFLRGAPEYAESLSDVGFNLLNTMNNHALDHGKYALDDTVSSLENYKITALKFDGEPYTQPILPTILNAGRYRIGFFSFCLNLGTLKCAVDPPNIDKISEAIKTSRHEHALDYVIVSLHWGYEYVHYPSLEQVKLAHKIVDAGADVILGHHPHVLQPVEMYNGKLIFYSLGNFVFDFNMEPDSRIYHIDLKNLENLQYTPILIGKYGRPVIQGQKKMAEIYESEELTKKIPHDYMAYVSEKKRTAKKKMVRTALKNSFRYGPSWYMWYIKKNIKV